MDDNTSRTPSSARYYDDGQCAICLGHHVTKSKLQCGHIFCFECLVTWAQIRLECPTCKAPFSTFNHQTIGSPPTGNYDSVFEPDTPAVNTENNDEWQQQLIRLQDQIVAARNVEEFLQGWAELTSLLERNLQ